MCFFFSNYSPEVKEGKEGAEQEKSAEQENNDTDKIEKELEKDKVSLFLKKKNIEFISNNIKNTYNLITVR